MTGDLRPCSAVPDGVHLVPVASLLPGDSPRLAGENREHTRLLAESGEPFPPLLVRRETRQVIDGMHRLRAAELRGDAEIAVVYFDGSSEEAFLRAVRANAEHGLPLTRTDRRAAVARIVATHPGLSDRAVAAHTGLSAKTVAGIRRSSADLPQSNERLGADGRVRPLNSAAGRLLAAEAIAREPDAPLREIARTAGISLSTAHDVRRRLTRLQPPVPARYRQQGGAPRADPGLLLERLMRDPALRHTGPGRELLRALRAVKAATAECAQQQDLVPAHCAEMVALLARTCASELFRFATELDQH